VRKPHKPRPAVPRRTREAGAAPRPTVTSWCLYVDAGGRVGTLRPCHRSGVVAINRLGVDDVVNHIRRRAVAALVRRIRPTGHHRAVRGGAVPQGTLVPPGGVVVPRVVRLPAAPVERPSERTVTLCRPDAVDPVRPYVRAKVPVGEVPVRVVPWCPVHPGAVHSPTPFGGGE
jgi:hypothetical protein